MGQLDTKGSTALHGAAANGRTAVIPLLLRAGMPVDIPNAKGETALHCAVKVWCSCSHHSAQPLSTGKQGGSHSHPHTAWCQCQYGQH